MKRFYKDVSTAAADGGWRVLLDGRPIKTVGGAPQIAPTQALAAALADEWAAQGEKIDAAALPLRDMADYALDVIAPDRAAAQAALIPYGETDTLCYRADEGSALLDRQIAVWEPLLNATEARYDIHFERVSGIIHRPQPAATLARLQAALAAEGDFALAALRNLVSLAASLVVGLAALEPGADVAALWQAACLEEEWQADLWGRDAEAEARRARRTADFARAARFAALARG
ncbi:MAG TPA: ATP12 family protein [Novosphingobium sp.]|nr:ATP12 family protein [Novosphingobium sp.]